MIFFNFNALNGSCNMLLSAVISS